MSELEITACMDVLTTFALQIGQVTFLVTDFDWIVRSSAAAGAAEDRLSLLPSRLRQCGDYPAGVTVTMFPATPVDADRRGDRESGDRTTSTLPRSTRAKPKTHEHYFSTRSLGP